MAAEKQKPSEFSSAAARKNYLDGLKSELEGYKRNGNEARQADVTKEIQRVAASSAKTPTRNTASTPPAQA